MEELKPCPFCGGEAEISGSSIGAFAVGCADWDGCIGFWNSCNYYNTEAEAIAAWNKRAERSSMKELKPCPFCGSEFTQVRYMGGKWQEPSAFNSGYRGECCECGAITAAYDTEAEAISAWNTRHNGTAADEQ